MDRETRVIQPICCVFEVMNEAMWLLMSSPHVRSENETEKNKASFRWGKVFLNFTDRLFAYRVLVSKRAKSNLLLFGSVRVWEFDQVGPRDINAARDAGRNVIVRAKGWS